MKKLVSLLLALVMALSLVACGNDAKPSADGNRVTLTVFAAASLTESLNAIGEKYMADNQNVTLVFNYDSSGTLYKQIKEGAVCDLFISAAPKQMNQLDGTLKDDAEKNPDGLDMLLAGSRIDLLENKVALTVTDGNPKGIDSFDKLADLLKSVDVKLAIGNADVPVGQYTQKIFKFYNIDETAVADKLTYGANVKEVTTAVSEGTVDCGIIYASDAYSAKLTVAATATADMCGQVIYPAAILSGSTNQDAAAAFLKYLQAARPPQSSRRFSSPRFPSNPTTLRDVGQSAPRAPSGPVFFQEAPMDWYPLLNSLRIAAISAVVVFFAGIAAAYYIAKLPRLLKGILDVVLTLPLVLPPTVVGYLLLRVLGPKRLIGAWVLETFGIRLVMTWWSAIFATVVVVFPLMYRTVRGAFEAFDETLAYAGQTLGLSNTRIFWQIRMPNCRQGIIAGAVLAFARALGEYGATSMVAGYTPGKTATISTTVYQLWQLNNDELALKWVLVNVGISAVILLVVNMLERKNLLTAASRGRKSAA